MAAKRFRDENPCSDKDQPREKRANNRLAMVIRAVVMENSMKSICKAVEPMLRRVVQEEVERGLRHLTRSLGRSHSLPLQSLEPSTFEFKFSNSLSLPIFTGTKIVDQDGAPLHIILVNKSSSHNVLPSPIKIEIVVLEGDFPADDQDDWTSKEFDSNIVHARKGKRPLIAGDLSLIMRGGIVSVGELELTDNSSWIRSRRFRIGARVSPGSHRGVQILEAITEAFVVKDHRGELYKKHHPPSLKDQVWRLEKVAKDGPFHRKLASANINTVQDFLKLSVIDQSRLREILGAGMSKKMWKVTLKHARECLMGDKHYIYRGHNFSIALNPICEVMWASIDNQLYSEKDLSTIHQPYIENLVRQAHSNWEFLEETEVTFANVTTQLTQGEMENHLPNHRMAYPSSSTAFNGANNWDMGPEFMSTPIEQQAAGRIQHQQGTPGWRP